MSHLVPRGIALLCLTSVTIVSAFAQSEVGGATLNGTVSDPSGASVAGAIVKISSDQTGFTRASTSNAAGLYSFVRVPVGTYSLSVEHPGFRTERQSAIKLQVGAVATLDVQLQIGAAQEVVSVTAEVPVVETTRSSTATAVNEREVGDLPVNGRNFLSFTTATPGVVADPTRSGDLAFGGQRGTANSLLIDGGEGNNLFYGQATGRTGFRPYAFSQDAVQEFQVNTNAYQAEIGRAGGGVINAVTKSGTNQFHGDAFEFYRDKGMNANTFTNNRGGVRRQPYHFHQFGGSMGGPVVKDKVFFFLNYDGQRNTLPQVLVPNIAPPPAALALLSQYFTPYTTGFQNDVGLAKVDWNIGAADHLTVRYNAGRVTGQNLESAGLASAQQHTGDSQVVTDNIAASYTKVFGPNLISDTRYIFLRDNEPGFANSTAPETIITNGITFGRNNFSPRYTNAKTNQIVDTVSWIRGRHTVKFGLDFNFERIANYFPGLFSGSYTFPSYADFLNNTPSQFTQAFPGAGTSGPLTQPNVKEFASFAQDSWTVNKKLTLNLGVRYDFFDYAQPTVFNPDAGLAAMGLRTDRIRRDKTNFAPRLGFAYKPFNDDRTVIRGGYGIYFERTPTILTGTQFSQNGIQVRTYVLTPGPGFPTYPNVLAAAPTSGASPSIFVTTPDFATPRTNQYSLNIEREVGPGMSVTIGYLGVHGNHLTRTRDMNLFPEQLVQGIVCPTSAACTTGQAFPYYRHPGTGAPARPNSNFGRISLFESGGDSVYNGVFIQFTKRYSNHFTILTSYTYSHVIDDSPDATAVVVGADDGKQAQDSLNPNLERGNGNADARHRFVFSGVWDITYARSLSNPVLKAVLRDWQFSTVAQMQSGRFFSATVSGDPNNDGNNSNDRVPFLGRNTIQGPNFMAVDVRLTRDIPLYKESVRLRLIGEAFNLTNRANFNSLQTNQYTFRAGIYTPTTNFLVPQSTFDPRILQLAAKIIF